MHNNSDEGFHHPLWALYLLGFFLTPDELNSFLGDLEEVFSEVAAEHGPRAAKRYYTFQVLTSCGSFLKGRLHGSALFRALGFLHDLIEFVKKLGP